MKKVINKTRFPFRRTRPLILAFLFVSGSCGLIYEILWMKMLTLVIGNTVFAITTVLTAFMGGLALGSFLAGRFIDKIKDPLRTYGIMEGGIGVYALLLPLFIAGTEPLFRIIYQGINPSFYTFSLLRFVVCGIILLIPTTLMGATLPVLSKYFVEKPLDLGLNVGMLYGVNTFGAVLGSFMAGFVLIPILGISWTIDLAALLNLLIAGGMLKLAKNRSQLEPSVGKGKPKDKKREEERSEEVVPEIRSTIQWVVMVGIGISGIAAMIYQIAWTKVLLLSIGSSVYAFSLIVTAFICGLALGSLIISKFIDRRRDLVLWLALMQGAIGISALLIVPLLGKLPVFVAETIFTSSKSFQYVHFAEFAVIFGLILVPTFMMGAVVPMAIKICTTDIKRVGRFFGNVYAVNTLGAIIGSFAAGFLLIPWLGAQNSIFIAVAMNITAAGVILLHAPTLSSPRRFAGALVTAVIAFLVWSPISRWDPSILTSGLYLYADRYMDASAEKKIGLEEAVKEGHQLLFFKEGLHALVSVEKASAVDLALEINGKTEATAKADAPTQLMVGHLPLLLHQGTRDVLVIGLGSGMTLGAVERYPVERIDVVEIETAVVEASRYFDDFSGYALNDPRVNLIVADGRNHLALTSRQYDVIISEPSNPWVSGMANLFTREFFDLAKKRLQKGGLMCQWVHAYSMSSVDFKTIVRTFHAVFPHVTVWEADLGIDYLLIGSSEHLDVDYEMLRNRLTDERMSADMGKMDIRGPAAFMSKLIMTEEEISEYTKGVPLHTDANTLLAYSAPKALLKGRSTRLFEELYHHGSDPVRMLRSLQWFEIPRSVENDLLEKREAQKEVRGGYIRYAKEALQDAINSFENALAISPGDYDATYRLAKLNYDIGLHFRGAQRPVEATGAYEKSLKAIDGFTRGDRALLSDHFKLEVIYAKAHLDLGVMALKANRLKQAAEAFQKSLSGEVRYAEAHNNLGSVYGRMGEYDAAVNQFQLAIELNPKFVSARMNMGNALLRQEKYGEAVEIYLQAQKLRPDSALTHYNLGVAYFKQNQWDKAEKEWKRALALKPDYLEAQRSLNVVRNKEPLL
jgi:spermidine synthase